MSLVDSTATVRRGGSYLTIPANAVERYLAKGYDVVDENDNVIKSSVPNDINTLKIAYEQHIAKIKELEAQVKELKAQIAKSAKHEEKAEAVETHEEKDEVVETVDTPPVVEAKPKTRKSKKSE